MCQHFSNWKENKQGLLINAAGKVVENSQGFLKIKSEVQKLSMIGVQVSYYHIEREENKEADALAKKGRLWVVCIAGDGLWHKT